MAEKPQTRHHAPAEDGAGLLGKRRPDGGGRAGGLHRHRPRPRHDPGGRQGGRHQRAQCRAAADGAHRHDPADARGRRREGASPTRPTCSASWSRTASAMPGRGSCSPSRAGRPIGELGQRLRSTTENRLGAYESFTVDDARRYHAATYSIGMGAARLFSRSVDLSGRKQMLDLGGGSGAYSIVATKTFPGLKAIVLDLPPVAVVAGEYIAANDAADRVSTLPGDFTRTHFPQGVDVVVMASNLPQYEPDADPPRGRQGVRRPRAGRRDAPDRRDPARRPARAAVGRPVGPQRGGLGQHRPGPHRMRGERLSAGRGIRRRRGPSLRAGRAVAGGRAASPAECRTAGLRRPGPSTICRPPASLPSSRGLGRGPLKAETRVRIP